MKKDLGAVIKYTYDKAIQNNDSLLLALIGIPILYNELSLRNIIDHKDIV